MPNKIPTPQPTPAELELLRILWRTGPADAKKVAEALTLERADASYATVLRQLQLMHAKGMLTRDESQRPQRYAGSGKALVLAALKEHVSADDRAEIEQILRRQNAPRP